jgi:hypothetical protein
MLGTDYLNGWINIKLKGTFVMSFGNLNATVGYWSREVMPLCWCSKDVQCQLVEYCLKDQDILTDVEHA